MQKAKVLLVVVLLLPGFGFGKSKAKDRPVPTLESYLQRVQHEAPVVTMTSGSLWPLSGGLMTDLASDYKARRVNDLVVVRIVEQTLAQASGSVAAQRSFSASSGITALAGQVNTAGVQELFSPFSQRNLKGAGTSNSQTQLNTVLSGRVVAVLPNGNMVIEAERTVSFNQEDQVVILRGLARPFDVLADNSVLSTSLSDLEIEMKGKGVVSDSTRQPGLFMRLLLRLVNF